MRVSQSLDYVVHAHWLSAIGWMLETACTWEMCPPFMHELEGLSYCGMSWLSDCNSDEVMAACRLTCIGLLFPSRDPTLLMMYFHCVPAPILLFQRCGERLGLIVRELLKMLWMFINAT